MQSANKKGRVAGELIEKALLAKEKYLQDFVFIHINKNAGSSIEKALGLNFEDRHKTALEKVQELGLKRWTDKFTFTIVRNPWDRVVSHYCFRVKTNQTDLKTNPIYFPDWVRLVYVDRDPVYHDKPKMFLPQLDWIADREGRILVDYVGRFENLEEDFKVICDRLGIVRDLPHEKKSPKRGNYRDYYDDSTAAIVEQYFKKDIERLDYRF